MTTSEFRPKFQFTQKGIKAAQRQRCCARDLYLKDQNVSELSLNWWLDDTLLDFVLKLGTLCQRHIWLSKFTCYADMIKEKNIKNYEGEVCMSFSFFFFLLHFLLLNKSSHEFWSIVNLMRLNRQPIWGFLIHRLISLVLLLLLYAQLREAVSKVPPWLVAHTTPWRLDYTALPR